MDIIGKRANKFIGLTLLRIFIMGVIFIGVGIRLLKWIVNDGENIVATNNEKVMIAALINYIIFAIIIITVDYKIGKYINNVYYIGYVVDNLDVIGEKSFKDSLDNIEKLKTLNKTRQIVSIELTLAANYLMKFNEFKPEYLEGASNTKLSKCEKILFYKTKSLVSYFNNDFEEALGYIEALIKIEQIYVNLLFKAVILQQMGKTAEANKIVSKYEKSNKKYLTKIKGLRIIHIYHQKLEEPFRKFFLGIYYSNLNEKDKAISLFNWVIENTKDNEFLNIKSKEYVENLGDELCVI